tara:strand:- start:5631 stop:6008 length:378 start_codon:yes stop_codon:yes gene_type:complete
LAEDSVFVGDIYEATRDGKIRAYECTECNYQGVAVQAFCDKCGNSKLTIKEIGNIGKVITYTIQTVAPDPFVNEVPYAWVIVELDNNVRITGWIPFVSSREDLKIGDKVKLVKSYKPGMVFEKIT